MDIKFTALLPMKGHSERIPSKNLRSFCGKPLFSYILDTLLQCWYVDEVYVDTDSEEIMKLTEQVSPRVHTIVRPEELRGDMVSMNDIIAHDVKQAGTGYFIQTHATNPLLKVGTIEAACEKFLAGAGSFDSLFSVNCLQTRLYDKDGHAVNHDPNVLIRTQDLEPLYEENSNFYIFTQESFQLKQRRIGRFPQMFPMEKLESLDIDEEQDFLLAEHIYRMIHGQ